MDNITITYRPIIKISFNKMTDKNMSDSIKEALKIIEIEVRAMPVAVASLQTTDSKVQRAAQHNLFV